MRSKYSQDTIIDAFRKIHGGKFDYSLVRYVNTHTKVTIVCVACGHTFSQLPNAHLKGQGCRKCRDKKNAERKAEIKKCNAKRIVEKFQRVHGNQYDYDRLRYEGANKRVEIGCRKCGRWFWSFPNNHLRGKGCQHCAQSNRGQRQKVERSNNIIRLFMETHGDKYDYEDIVYIDAKHPVKIKCNTCGNVFNQLPGLHEDGAGCKRCADKKKGKDKQDEAARKLIQSFVSVHGDKYDYENVVYKGDKVHIEIKCKSCGDLFSQTPSHHKQGCGAQGAMSRKERGWLLVS